MNMQMSVKVKKFLLKTKLLFVVLTFLFPAPASFAIEPMSDPTNPQGPVVPFVADASQETTVIEVRPGESIQAAIDQARDGDVILLSEGTYDYSGALTVNKAITLRGQTREGVILRSNIVVDADGATLENLTVDPEQFVYSGGVQGGIGTFRAATSITISGRGNSVKNCTIKGFSPLLVESAQDTLLDHNLILDRAALWSLRGYENAALRPAVWIRDSNGIEILHNTISVPDRVSYLWGYRFADGHGVVESSSDNIVIKNSIIVVEGGSDFQHGSAIVYDGAAPTVTYSIVRTDDLALLNQTGVFNADPLFVSDTDFRLRSGSPAIDAGDPDSPRDPDGTRADIGFTHLVVATEEEEEETEEQREINEAQSLIAQYTSQNGRLRYRPLAEALVNSGDARLAARVIAQIAISSYRATGQTDTRLLNQITGIGFLIETHAVGNPAEFWNPYELTQNESPAVVGPVRTALERRIRSQGAVFTPQGDKIIYHVLYHVAQLSSDLLAIYDVQTGRTRYQGLGAYGFGGIKMVTSDGRYAIVASTVNTVYIVPLHERVQATRLVHLPVDERVTDSVLVSARPSREDGVVRLTLRSGKQYLLNYLTGEFFQIERQSRREVRRRNR